MKKVTLRVTGSEDWKRKDGSEMPLSELGGIRVTPKERATEPEAANFNITALLLFQ